MISDDDVKAKQQEIKDLVPAFHIFLQEVPSKPEI